MGELIALIEGGNLALIIIVLLVCIPSIVKVIEWIAKLIQKIKSFRQNEFKRGQQAVIQQDTIEDRFEDGEERIEDLEMRECKLEDILRKQQQQTDSLIESDNLNIKRQIKKTWDKVRITRTIDSYELDLLEHQFRIYQARGGNSWAEDMMKEIRAIATTTSVILPKADTHD